MTLEELRDSLVEEIRTIVSPTFKVKHSPTSQVPSVDDRGITYAYLGANAMTCRTIETCVLYVDIRESTRLNLEHNAVTIAKLYAFFGRAMAQCASMFGGEVRGIVGDRVMVLFEEEECIQNAVHTAVLINSVSQYVLNKHFPYDEVRCGIGVDYGRMLVVKTGTVRRGTEGAENKSLVWLGQPANIASKLTDVAGKPLKSANPQVAPKPAQSSPLSLDWARALPAIAGLPQPVVPAAAPKSSKPLCPRLAPPILVTEAVFRRYVAGILEQKQRYRQKALWKPQAVRVPGYKGRIYGSRCVFPCFGVSV